MRRLRIRTSLVHHDPAERDTPAGSTPRHHSPVLATSPEVGPTAGPREPMPTGCSHHARKSRTILSTMAFASVEPLRPPRSGRVRSARIELADGARTMVHVARYDTASTELRVAVLRGQARLEAWCAARGVRRGARRRLLRAAGRRAAGRGPHARRRPPLRRRSTRRGTPCARACTSAAASPRSPRAASSSPRPAGDLLQAGPLLVRDGRVVFSPRRRRRGLQRRRVPVRLRHHRRPLPARRARPRRRPAVRGRLRRPLAPRRGPDARRAGRADGRARLRRRR